MSDTDLLALLIREHLLLLEYVLLPDRILLDVEEVVDPFESLAVVI